MHSGQSGSKDSGDLNSLEVARHKNEHARTAGTQSCDFQRSVSKPLIFREYHPRAFSDLSQPDLVFFIPFEMVVVDFDLDACVGQYRSQRFDAKGAIYKEDEFRRLGSGSLLRWHLCSVRSLWRVRRLSRQLCSVRKWPRLEFQYLRRLVFRRRRMGS